MDVCPIPSNSDIAGVGIRVATYMQASTTFIVTLLAITYRFMDMFSRLEDAPIAPSLRRFDISALLPDLRSTLVGLRNGLSVASISVLISAIVLAFSEDGLTVYHGLVTLNLAQLNSLSSLFVWLVAAFTHESPKMDVLTAMVDDLASESGISRDSESDTSSTSRSSSLGLVVRTFFVRVFRGSIHFVVHASLAGGFGLWFWSNQSRFEHPPQGSDCISQTMYWFFVPLNSHNKHIRDFFLAYNSLLVFPLTAPIAATLLSVGVAMVSVIPLMPLLFWGMMAPSPWPTISVVIGLVGLGGGAYVLPMAFYIYSTEKTIQLNQAALADGSEKSWSYGQTLALITALMSSAMLLWDLAKLVKALVKGAVKTNSKETTDEGKDTEKPQEMAPTSSAVSLRDPEATIRSTGTHASRDRTSSQHAD